MALPVKKIHIGTVFKAAGSRSNSDFRFEPPESVTLPDDTAFYVEDIAIPRQLANHRDRSQCSVLLLARIHPP